LSNVLFGASHRAMQLGFVQDQRIGINGRLELSHTNLDDATIKLHGLDSLSSGGAEASEVDDYVEFVILEFFDGFGDFHGSGFFCSRPHIFVDLGHIQLCVVEDSQTPSDLTESTEADNA